MKDTNKSVCSEFIVNFGNISVKNVKADNFHNAIFEALKMCWNVEGMKATTEQTK